MQLLHNRETILATVKDLNMMSTTMATKDMTSDSFEVKEKRSSDGCLLLMNRVASGDNVATGLNSAHKLKEDLPLLVPCCEGKELQRWGLRWSELAQKILELPHTDGTQQSCLAPDSGGMVVASQAAPFRAYHRHWDLQPPFWGSRINEELVCTGLSAISVKHDKSVIQCLSMSRACERMMVPPGLVKHRNSFRSLHRPDLKRVPYLRRMSPDELEILFRGYADFPVKPNSDNPRTSLPLEENRPHKREAIKELYGPDDGNNGVSTLHLIPETQSGAEDVPAGMRLHGARARLYTSVLAGVKDGDQLDANQTTEDYDHRVPDEPLPDDEVTLHEELQIILPPRCDDVTAESSTTTTTTGTSAT